MCVCVRVCVCVCLAVSDARDLVRTKAGETDNMNSVNSKP